MPECQIRYPGTPPSSGSGAPTTVRTDGPPLTETCTAYDYDVASASKTNPLSFGPKLQAPDYATLKPGDPVWMGCTDIATGATRGYAGTWTPADYRSIALDMLAAIDLTKPTVHLWPIAERQVVGLATWLRADELVGRTPVVDTRKAADGQVVTLTATPTHALWHLPYGDGFKDVTCVDAGREWKDSFHDGIDTTTCSYTPFKSTKGATVEAWADLIYQVTWSTTNGQAGSLGTQPARTRFQVGIHGYDAVGK